MRHERLTRYLRYGDPGGVLNPFRHPDDHLAFIMAHLTPLAADARRGFQRHGRGLVVLEGPHGPYLDSWYMTIGPDDFKGHPEAAHEVREGYDPASAMLIGATDPAVSYFRFWRIDLRRQVSRETGDRWAWLTPSAS
jgi:hypothetical protein